MVDEQRTARIELRVPPSVKKAAERTAARDGRTLTNWLEKLIADALAKEPKR